MRTFKPEGLSSSAFRSIRTDHDEWLSFKGERRRLWFELPHDTNKQWPCCYALYQFGELVYIGQTGNLQSRIRQHKSKRAFELIDWSEITIKAKLCRRFGEWAMAEVRLIDRLSPPWNRHLTRNRESMSFAA